MSDALEVFNEPPDDDKHEARLNELRMSMTGTRIQGRLAEDVKAGMPIEQCNDGLWRRAAGQPEFPRLTGVPTPPTPILPQDDDLKLDLVLFAEHEPRKPVMKMAALMAEQLGGEITTWQWISSSEIEFEVHFEHKRVGDLTPIAYDKNFRITVSGCDNNAAIPAKRI